MGLLRTPARRNEVDSQGESEREGEIDRQKERETDRGRERQTEGLPRSPVVKNPPANVGDMGSLPAPGRSHTPKSN